MPQNERLRVWKGELKKTSGGLRKQDLMKNKRGKIVSRKKSDAARKNKENNLGQWLRSKGDKFLSKGLKQEDIARKGKRPNKKKEEDVPEEKQSEVKKPPKGRTKQKAPKKISKTAPMKPGEKPKDKTKISVGNIVLNRKEIKEYREGAKFLMKELDMTKKEVIKDMGKPPEGFTW